MIRGAPAADGASRMNALAVTADVGQQEQHGALIRFQTPPLTLKVASVAADVWMKLKLLMFLFYHKFGR